MSVVVQTISTPDGSLLCYREYRQPEGVSETPLLLLHANPGDSRDYDAVVPVLGASGFRVIALDWPAYGGSPAPALSGEAGGSAYAATLDAFVTALGLPPAILIGNSIGGNAAVRFAASRPQAVVALVLVSPGGFTTHTCTTRAFCSFQGSSFSLPPRFFASRYLHHRTPAVLAMLERAGTIQSEPSRIAFSRAVWRSFSKPSNDVRDVARALRVPTLLIFGRYDPVIPAVSDGTAAHESIRGSELVVLQTGHAPFAEDPDEFLVHVLRFLAAFRRL